MVPLRIGLVTSGGSAAYHDFVQELEASPYAFRVALCTVRVQGAAADRRVAYALPPARGPRARRRGGGARRRLARRSRRVRQRGGGARHRGDARARAHGDRARGRPHRGRRSRAHGRQDADGRGRHARRPRRAVRRRAASRLAPRRDSRGQPRAITRATESTGSGTAPSRAGRAGARDAQRGLAARQQSILAAARRGTRDALRRVDADDVRLRALDPRRVLERGYSITRAETGAVIRSGSAVTSGAILVTEVADGTITSRVVEDAS